jgi:hypothetical protein
MTNLWFGTVWVAFAFALALHVADEAKHDFLATYNPSMRAIRARLPFLPLSAFRFGVWLGLLTAGILLLLALSPLVFRGSDWLRIASRPLAIVVAYSMPVSIWAALFISGGECRGHTARLCCWLRRSSCWPLRDSAAAANISHRRGVENARHATSYCRTCDPEAPGRGSEPRLRHKSA